MNYDLKSMTTGELEALFVSLGHQKFLGKTVFSFIHAHGASGIDRLSTLSKSLRAELCEQGFFISRLVTVEVFKDPDGTNKYLFELADGNRIETVELTDENERRTLCISTQVGCRMGCAFCATGRLHFTRNLTAGEIAGQVLEVEKASGEKIGNVVYMGMGEPFDNYDETLKSVRILNDPAGRNIGARHITISTSGIIPGIEKLASEDLQVRLAISLHSARDEARQKIMGVGRKYPLEALIDAVRDYQAKTRRRVTFEYVMIKGINDASLDARAIVRLIRGIKANINLIEYNPHEGCDFAPSDRKTIKVFGGILTAEGFEVAIRYKRGQQIKAACGQLGTGWLKTN
jgi:23S rRNA (adenine2503-C2)-methyltransferase